MKLFKSLFMVAVIAFAFTACQKTEKSADSAREEAKEAVQKAQENLDEAVNALAKFEYVCDHCQVGSHEAGKCNCGMKMAKNANFVAVDDTEGQEAEENSEEDSNKEEESPESES